jgi:hypothetical protein
MGNLLIQMAGCPMNLITYLLWDPYDYFPWAFSIFVTVEENPHHIQFFPPFNIGGGQIVHDENEF